MYEIMDIFTCRTAHDTNDRQSVACETMKATKPPL